MEKMPLLSSVAVPPPPALDPVFLRRSARLLYVMVAMQPVMDTSKRALTPFFFFFN